MPAKDLKPILYKRSLNRRAKWLGGKSEEDDGEYMQYFGDTLNQSYAEAITESGQVGLAKQLYDSMKRN